MAKSHQQLSICVATLQPTQHFMKVAAEVAAAVEF